MAQKANLSPRQPIQFAQPPQPLLTCSSGGVANIPDKDTKLVQSVPNGPPLAAVLERLKQLKLWQQQQQETLLHQQQEQLLKLRNEQENQRSLFVRSPSENFSATDIAEHTQPYDPPLPTKRLPKSESENLEFSMEMSPPSVNERHVITAVSANPPTDEHWEAGIDRDCRDEASNNEEEFNGDVTLDNEDDRAIEYYEKTVSASPVSRCELISWYV